jgi:glutathione S-transferase
LPSQDPERRGERKR